MTCYLTEGNIKMDKKKILIAIGGNSLIKDNKHLSVDDQYKAICETTCQIAEIIQDGHDVAITHGNGPQVGFILHRSEIASQIAHMHTVPLVSCDADTQGAIGYQIQQALDNEFRKRKLSRNAITIITQVLVDKDDEAFKTPAKPIGQFYTEKEYKILSKTNPGWKLVEDSGRGYRRVVASPHPLEIIEFEAINSLFNNNFVVIAAGGGGIPVIKENEILKGIDAVIDKDKASALLASELNMDTLIISTGVRNIAINFNTPDEEPIKNISIDKIKKHLQDNQFAKGSMLPKIEAAINFLENGGKEVIITDPDNLANAFFNGSGTHIK